MCRVFLFSYSCGWFSPFACPVFLLTICVSCCQLAFVQQRGLRQRIEERRSVHQLTSVMALQFSSSAKFWQSALRLGHNLKSLCLARSTHTVQHTVNQCLQCEGPLYMCKGTIFFSKFNNLENLLFLSHFRQSHFRKTDMFSVLICN